MPFVSPPEHPYSDDSSPGANDGDIVYASIVNVIMDYLEDDLPGEIAAAGGVVASDADPEDLGTPDSGVSTDLSRADHVHQMPSAADVGAATSADISAAIDAHEIDTDPHGDRAYADSLFDSITEPGNIYQGIIDCSGNPDYPAADQDHTYRVSVAGKIGGASGVDVEIGDLAICLNDGTASGNQATVGSSWTIAQGNLNGVVIGPTVATNDRIALFSGTSGKLIKQASQTIADLDAYAVAETADWPGSDPTTQTAGLNVLAERVTDAEADITTAQSDITTLDGRVDALEVLSISAQTANYILVLGDAGKVVEMDNASARTITVPPNADVAFPVGTVIEVCQVGAGALSVVAGSGVTIRSIGSALDLQAQWATASLRKRATNEWVLTGELS